MSWGGAGINSGHFNHLAKNSLEWMPDSKTVEASANGTYRIYRFDHKDAIANPLLAVKVPVGDGVNYWVGYRQLYTSSSYNLETGAHVVAENLSEGRQTNLIDMTPNSSANENTDRNDSALPVGSSLALAGGAVTIESVARGGVEPNQYIDVEVTFATQVALTSTVIEVDEQQGVARIEVERSFGSDGVVTIDYATSNATSGSIATLGSDYYGASGTLRWDDGDLSPKTIVVPIRPDAVAEGREDFVIILSNPSGAVLVPSLSEATVSILDPGERFAGFAPGFFNNTINDILTLEDGRVVVTGNIHSGIGSAGDIRHLAILNADGSVDNTFITGSGLSASGNCLARDASGNVYVGGSFTSYDGVSCNGLVKIAPDGTVDSAFAANVGAGAPDEIECIGIEANGDLLIGGSFDSFNGVSALGLIRLNSNGTVDTVNPLTLGFISGSSSTVRGLLIDSNGMIIIAGTFWYAYDNAVGGFRSGISRLNSDGSRDDNFEPGTGVHAFGSVGSLRNVFGLSEAPGGRYLIAGSFSAYNEVNVNDAVIVNSDGSLDTSFSSVAFSGGSIRPALAQDSGRVLIGGWFTEPDENLVGLTSSGAVDTSFAGNGGPGGTVYVLADDGRGAVWVGGNFYSYAGESSRPIVKIAGGSSPYDIWASGRFTAAQFTSGVTDPEDDPDNDDITNEEEFALGTNPSVSNVEPAFGLGGKGGIDIVESGGMRYLELTLDKTTLGEGAWFAAQFSGDLITWNPANPTIGATSAYTIIRNTDDELVVRDNIPTTSAERRFARFSVVTP